MKDKGLIYNKCTAFSLRVIKLSQYLQNNCPYSIANQILRSGTSIGANYSESLGAESDQDFIHKLSISQKEIFETQYWLDILFKGEFLDSKLYHSLYADTEELYKLFSSSILTTRNKTADNTHNS